MSRHVAIVLAVMLATGCGAGLQMPTVETSGARTMVIENVQAHTFSVVTSIPFTVTVQGLAVDAILTLGVDVPSGSTRCVIETMFTAPVSCDALILVAPPEAPQPETDDV